MAQSSDDIFEWQSAHMDPHTLIVISCVCGCNSGDGSHTKKFSRTWFSHRAHWVSLLVPVAGCSLSATLTQPLWVFMSSPSSPSLPPSPPLCHHTSPAHALLHSLTGPSCIFNSLWHEGRFKSRLFKEARSVSNSLITWQSVPASWLCRYSHTSPASYLFPGLGKSTSWVTK